MKLHEPEISYILSEQGKIVHKLEGLEELTKAIVNLTEELIKLNANIEEETSQ